jgi:hypothetical protein
MILSQKHICGIWQQIRSPASRSVLTKISQQFACSVEHLVLNEVSNVVENFIASEVRNQIENEIYDSN